MKPSSGSFANSLVTIGTYLNAFSQWYLIWLFARTSGAETAGQYASIFAYATPVFALAHFGLRDHFLTSTNRYGWNVYVSLRAVGIALGVGVMCALIYAVPLSGPMAAAVIFMKVANAVLDLYNGRIQRNLDFMLLGLISVANAAVTLVVATTAAAAFGSAVGAVWASGVVSALCGIAAWRRGGQDAMLGEGRGRSSFIAVSRGALPITVADLAYTLSASVPIIIVERSGSPEDVGVFSAAAYLLTVANLTGAAVRVVKLPQMAAIYRREGVRELRRESNRLALLALVVGLLGAGVATAFGPAVLSSVYGPEFAMDRAPIALLASAAALTIPAYMITGELLALNAYRSQSAISIAALGVGVAVGAAVVVWGGASAITAGATAAFASKVAQIVLTVFARPGGPREVAHTVDDNVLRKKKETTNEP